MSTILKTTFFVLSVLSIEASAALTQSDFVERLEKTHSFFIQQRMSSEIVQLDRKSTDAISDWNLFASTGFSSTEDRLFDDADTTNGSVNLSASKTLVNLGSSFSVSKSWNRSDGNSEILSNGLSASYTHSLLQGSGGINSTLQRDLADIDIQINVLSAKEQTEDFILGQLSKFISLAYLQENERIYQSRLNLVVKELALVKKKFDASMVDKVDVLLQEDAYQSAQQELRQAQQDLTLLRHEIAILLQMDFKEVVAEFDLYKFDAIRDRHLIKTLEAEARPLKILDLSKQQLLRGLASDKNRLKPSLNLTLGLSNAGDSETGSQLEKAWNVGLAFSYPLGNTASSTAVARRMINIRQLAESRRDQFLQLNIGVTKQLQENTLLTNMINLHANQIKVAKLRTLEEKDRYARGDGRVSFVVAAKDNEQKILLRYAQTAQSYHFSLLSLRASLDQLVP